MEIQHRKTSRSSSSSGRRRRRNTQQTDNGYELLYYSTACTRQMFDVLRPKDTNNTVHGRKRRPTTCLAAPSSVPTPHTCVMALCIYKAANKIQIERHQGTTDRHAYFDRQRAERSAPLHTARRLVGKKRKATRMHQEHVLPPRSKTWIWMGMRSHKLRHIGKTISKSQD